MQLAEINMHSPMPVNRLSPGFVNGHAESMELSLSEIIHEKIAL